MATDPVTSTTAATGIFAMLGNGLVYIAGAVGIVTLGKILIDYINMRKDVLDMKSDVKKILACSQNNAKELAVVKNDIEHLKEEKQQ